jgi:hypothetical protein
MEAASPSQSPEPKESIMKFAFLGYHLENNWDAMSKSQQEAMVEECFAYDVKLLRAGHMLDDGAALQSTRTAKSLRRKGGTLLVSDGPYAETKEQLGGIGVMEARNMEHAVELMSKHPGLRYGAVFEIRPIDEESLRRQAAFFEKWRGGAPAAKAQGARFAWISRP